MRIRRSAARLLGSAYSGSASYPAPAPDAALPFELPLPTPPPPPPPCSAAPESLVGVGFPAPATSSVDRCVLSCSPWDLLAELTIFDSEVEDELLDRYFVHVANRPGWLLTASMPASKGQLVAAAAGGDNNLPSQCQVAKKALKTPVAKKALKKPVVCKEMGKEREGKKKPKVMKEEAEEEKPQVWTCKKNDGKRWWCQRTVSQPNSLCDYHFSQKHPNFNPEMVSTAAVPAVSAVATPKPTANSKPKPATNSKPRKKKPAHNFGVSEGFYYYAGFGPFRSKRQGRINMQHDSVLPIKQEEDELPEDAAHRNQADQGDDTSRPVAHDDVSSYDDITQIAGLDEESSDDDMLDAFGGDIKSNGESRSNKDGDRIKKVNSSKKRWRKPVKARSLRSLM
ncbi:hypothetical protein ACP4OV_027850 [Aristida adscensionis]